MTISLPAIKNSQPQTSQRRERRSSSFAAAFIPDRCRSWVSTRSRPGTGFFLGVIVFAIFLTYSNTLQVPFILDDEPHILFNPSIKITELSWSHLYHAAFAGVSSRRPVANLSFALNYYFHGYELPGYHALNIFIHLATAVLLYFFLKTTLGLPSLRKHTELAGWLSFAGALIWSLNPVQTQSVTYIVQRMNSLAAMFYLLSFLCYVQARLAKPPGKKWLLFGTGLLAWLLALGSKENAATLPIFILLYEWYFFQDLNWNWLKRHCLFPATAALLLAGLAYFYLDGQPFQTIQGGYLNRDFTLTERLLTQFRVVVFYFSLLLFPHPSRLNLDHDIGLSTSWFAPPDTILAAVAIGCLVLLAVGLARHHRLSSFCLLWFLGNLVIESSVIGLEICFEHRNYLPSMLLFLPIIIIAGKGLPQKRLQGATLLLVVTVMAFWTYDRNKVWGDELSLWSDAAEKSPAKARPQNNLGTSMFHKGRYKEAIVSYSKVLQIEPEHAVAHNNLGFLLAGFGQVREAIQHYLEALRIQPNYERAHLNLGQALESLPNGNAADLSPETTDSLLRYLETVKIQPNYHPVRLNIGKPLKSKPNKTNIFSASPPDPVDSLLARGIIMADLNSPEEALDFFSQALAINPEHPEAHFRKGTVLANEGEIDTAIFHFTEALRLNPDDIDARFNLANALAGKRRFREAIDHFALILRLNPGDKDARRNLEILQRLGASP